uniref:non-specific serine/threonine protein kinase n=1 Tax=Callorhinchus milii TaxID=7868 RepID=V9KZA0_CALMI
MPSPIPINRFLPKGFSSTVTLRPCSSPYQLRGKEQRFSFTGRYKALPHLSWCTVFWDELNLLDLLGSGGFGSVYKGTYYGNIVAVKKVKKSTKNKLASRHSFWAELNVANLRHDNIVKVVAATTSVPEDPEKEDNLGTIIMEYAGDISLHHRIYNCTKTLEVGNCLQFSKDIVSGLSFLHSHNIVHLDLKPANVLISDQGQCKIGDFGCSHKLTKDDLKPNVQVRHLAGTYTHRAPELLKGCNATLKADIYSFAITLWQMMTRDQPFSGDRQCVMYAVVAYNRRPTFSATFKDSSMGQKIEQIIGHCWRAEPNERPNADQILETLIYLQAQHGVPEIE